MLVHQDGDRCIHQLVHNEIRTNCFIVQRGQQALLIDPSDRADLLLAYLQAQGLQLAAMLATHAHFDHVAAAGGIVAAGAAPALYLHPLDLPEYKRANSYSLMLFKRPIQVAPAQPFDAALDAVLRQFGLGLRHAGGHTRGSCWLHDLDGGFLITGDLVLHHALKVNLADSRENLAEFGAFVDTVQREFAPAAVLLPGHGAATTVGQEAALNRKWAHVRERLAA
ncbi:MBL fold metallo-hydrolase [Pseudaquabacterium pictum]|uniref:MBL fold hydrolase n=1 Tax=Pseudaquabacterium pictum TaxID=2315236 RepID=A0A480AWS4_9BURK|nr:MBL fold metallo-hydrolase [Rubrivivax pictus]GCL65934.1 MBL fold hydrolase [Rubrivivax pictus]